MTRIHLQRFLAAALLVAASSTLFGQMQRLRVMSDPEGKTGIEKTTDRPAPHVLATWMRKDKEALENENPVGGFTFRQMVTTLGTLSGHRIIQVLTRTDPPPALGSQPRPQRKSLLVQVAHSQRYAEIYGLEDDTGGFLAIQSAAIHGSGPNAILATIDPYDRNACSEGYWWFDSAGSHPVDLTPLERAISEAIPAEGTYNRCWAIHPEKAEIDGWVQHHNPQCRACNWMGELIAKYRIDHGAAIPVSVKFDADQSP
jgi:hypothetical protein